MTKPTIEDVETAKRDLDRARKDGGRWKIKLAREWYEIVKEASAGFDGLASYVPLRERGVSLCVVYDRFVAEREKDREAALRRKRAMPRERLETEHRGDRN